MTTKTAAHQDIQPSNASLNQPTQQMIVADGASDNIRELVKDAHAPVFLVEQTSHPLQVITTALAGERLDTLHIVAHGQSGQFQIGGQVIDERALRQSAALLAQWQVDEIVLWSCDVGADEGFVKTLAELTGAQVHASSETLGRTAQRANWAMPAAEHLMLPVSPNTLQSWGHSLGLLTLSFSGGFVGTVGNGNSADNVQSFDTLGWTNVQFAQQTTGSVFVASTAQGNDVPGYVVITDKNGNETQINGYIQWRITSGNDTLSAVFNAEQNVVLATNPWGASSSMTYSVGSADNSTGSYIGLIFNGESLTVTDGASLSGNAAGTLDSLNTYLGTQPKVGITDLAVNEADGNITVTVSLSAASNSTVSVQYDVGAAGDTATAPGDYTATTSGTLTFAAGVTQQTFTISIVDDLVNEGTETFSVVLRDAVNAAIIDDTGTITITDNDVITTSNFDMVDADDSGDSTDEITNDGTPALTFNGSPGLTIGVIGADGNTALTAPGQFTSSYDSSTGVYTVTLVDADGSSANGAGPFGTYDGATLTGNSAETLDGTYTITATSGSTTVTVGTFVIDSTPPTVPTVDALTTGDATPTLTGTATVGQGETLTVEVDGVTYLVGTDLTYDSVSGVWSLAIPAGDALTAATYPVTATVTDLAGNLSSDASTNELTITSFATGDLSMINGTDSGSNTSDEKTNNGLPSLAFNGTTGLAITLKGPDGTTLTAGTNYSVSDINGAYTITLLDANLTSGSADPFGAFDGGTATGNPLSTTDGTYTIEASTTGVNPVTATVGTFVIDTIAPTVPTIVSQVTSDLTPVITGTATLGQNETLSVTVNGATYDNVTVTNGTWSIDTGSVTPSSGTLGTFVDGNSYNVVVTATDLAGNSSVDTSAGEVTIDTTAPVVPTVTSQTTNDLTPTITGTATLGQNETLSVTVNGATYNNVAVTNNGTWSIDTGSATPSGGTLGAFVNGSSYSVSSTVTDAAGNASVDITSGEVTIKTSLTVGSLDMTDATDTGDSQNDELTANGLPVVTFTGEAGLTISLQGADGNTNLTAGTHYTVSYSNGTYTVTLLDAIPGGAAEPFGDFDNGVATSNPSATGDGTYTISATDIANNSQTIGTFEIDTEAPLGSVTVTAQTTTDTTPTITGTAIVATGETLSVVVNGQTYTTNGGGLTYNNGNNTWSLTVPNGSALSTGTYDVTATIADEAGNTVSDSTSGELVISAPSTGGGSQNNPPSNNPPSNNPSSGAGRPPAEPPGRLKVELDQNSKSDQAPEVTKRIDPEISVQGEQVLQSGTQARVVDQDGNVIQSRPITPADIARGDIKVAPGLLDDGDYKYTIEVLDENDQVVATEEVVVKVETDLDGVNPSTELRGRGGDFNRDGIPDWQQNNVAQMPVTSAREFAAGREASEQTFGAIIAGNVRSSNQVDVELDPGAQLQNLRVLDTPAPLPQSFRAATPLFDFTVTSQAETELIDLDPTREGLQTRVVIELQEGGVNADTYLKWDAVNSQWFGFMDDGDLSTFDEGATLLDADGDGRIDRVVVTLTDGGPGDDDGVANGVVVDPGLLAVTEPANINPLGVGVFSVRLSNGDRYYTADAADAARMSAGEGNVFEGVQFDLASGGIQRDAYINTLTGDWYFAQAGEAMPYVCYVPAQGAGFKVASVGEGVGVDFHLFMNGSGITQLATLDQAQALGLVTQGYVNHGAKFTATTESAFVFDAEAYLVTNQDNAQIQQLVSELAGRFVRTTDAGFIDAVELHYLGQLSEQGLSAGQVATVQDVNTAFGTNFVL